MQLPRLNKIIGDFSDLSHPEYQSMQSELKQTIEWLETRAISYAGYPDPVYYGTYRAWEYCHLLINLPLEVGGEVLDAACGNTLLPYHLARKGYKLTAIDKDTANLKVLQGNAEQLDLKLDVVPQSVEIFSQQEENLNRFSCITCVSAVEHMTPRAQVIFVRSLGRMLKPNGILGMTFDCMGGFGYPPSSIEVVEQRYLSETGLSYLGEPIVDESSGNRPVDLFQPYYEPYTFAALFLKPDPRVPPACRGAQHAPGLFPRDLQ